MAKQKSTQKKRNWAIVLYPESAPADWLEQLKQSGLMGAVSPLHDKDLDPDGNPKKAHYHVILCYAGPTSYNVVKSLADGLGQPIPQALESVRGYYRYLTHMDNPDKYQYSDADIVTYGGFDYRDYVEMTKSEVTSIIRNIQTFVRDNDVLEYADLLDLLCDNDMSDMYNVATSHTYVVDRYISSRRNKRVCKGNKQDNNTDC